MRYLIFVLNFFLFFFVFASSGLAYAYTLKGTAVGLTEQHIILSCPAWVADLKIPLNSEGQFHYEGTHEYPAMFTLTYGEGFQVLKADMFILNNIEIEVDLFSSEAEERVFIKLPSHRSSGFKKAQDFMDHIYVGKSTHVSVTENIVDMIYSQPYIGKDSLTQVYAFSEKLNYLMVLKEDYGKNISRNVFEMNEFYDLPINDIRYMGLRSYKNLMVHYNQRVIEDTTYRPKGVSEFETEFGKQVFVLEQYKKGIPEVVQVEVVKNILKRFPYATLSDDERNIYLERLTYLTNNYPNMEDKDELQDNLNSIVNSIENTVALPFELVSKSGLPVKLESLLGDTPIMIDVWGSWCRPCRANNQQLVALKEEAEKKGIAVRFVSIAKETDFSAWRAAIEKDKMDWLQLKATPSFIRNYQIHQYPTVILLDAQGVVRKVGASFSLEDLEGL